MLSATAFGRVWGWQLSFSASVVICLIVPALRHWWLLAVLATLALGNLGGIGHAMIGAGIWQVLNQSSQVLHLLSSGFWIGSLVPLLFCLRKLRDPVHGAGADVALRRFSGLGHFAVAIVLGTGVANTWFILGDHRIDPASLYQSLLIAKVVLVLAMIGLAVVNRYVFVPAIPNNGPGMDRLAWGTIAEMILTAGVLALVSVLGAIAPT